MEINIQVFGFYMYAKVKVNCVLPMVIYIKVPGAQTNVMAKVSIPGQMALTILVNGKIISEKVWA
jgi:hypothetical protein